MPFQYFPIINIPHLGIFIINLRETSAIRGLRRIAQGSATQLLILLHCRSCKKSVLKAANPDFPGVILFPRHVDYTCNIIYIICIHRYVYIYIYTHYTYYIYILYVYTHYIYIHIIYINIYIHIIDIYIYTHSWLLDTPSILVRLIPITIPSKPSILQQVWAVD